jgi:nucleoside-diphosphate-sugar epimerase
MRGWHWIAASAAPPRNDGVWGKGAGRGASAAVLNAHVPARTGVSRCFQARSAESLYVDDMAAASVHIMSLDQKNFAAHTQPMLSHINVGVGEDLSIRELAESVVQVVGYNGRVDFERETADKAQP